MRYRNAIPKMSRPPCTFTSSAISTSCHPRELGVPLRQIYPHDWNAYFEGYDKDLQYGGPGVDLSKYSAKYADTLELGYTSNKPLCEREQRATLEKLVFLQLELIPRVQEMLADGSFVRAWEGMGSEEKIDLALKALVRAADVAHERARVDCPEMSLYGLIGERKGDGEQGLISLFQEMATHDGTEGPMYIFRHPKFEEEIHLMSRGIPDTHWKRAYAGLRVMQRLLFISATLAAILDLHAGIPPSPRWLQDITRVYDTCFQCGIDAAAANLPDLRKCTGCAYALYCSPRCQKQNWAAHKPLCTLKNLDSQQNNVQQHTKVLTSLGYKLVPGYLKALA
ncbi:hypothetical protein C8F01DRAFT_1239183 [Mycena amicta]|nr:hypothetical protein C8F01DRAFT_1239183 [Mycena amicta]